MDSIKFTSYKNFINSPKFNVGYGISIIVGPNNAGKSNVSKAIRLLKSNLKYGLIVPLLDLLDNSLNLGSFNNCIPFKGDSKEVSFEITFHNLTEKFISRSFGSKMGNSPGDSYAQKFEFTSKKYQESNPAEAPPSFTVKYNFISESEYIGNEVKNQNGFNSRGVLKHLQIQDAEGRVFFILNVTPYAAQKSILYRFSFGPDIIMDALNDNNTIENGLFFSYLDSSGFELVPLRIPLDRLLEYERRAVRLSLNDFTTSVSFPHEINDDIMRLFRNQFIRRVGVNLENILNEHEHTLPAISEIQPTKRLYELRDYISDYYTKLLKSNPVNEIRFVNLRDLRSERLYSINGSSSISRVLREVIKGDWEIDYNWINDWLIKFNIGKSFRIREYENVGYSIYIKDFNGEELNVADLGSGSYQIFTQIFTLGMSIPGVGLGFDSVVLEEPELNLHPKLQSLLADLYVDVNISLHRSLLIETHSEYLIRKFQYLVAKKIIHSNGVIIYYLPDTGQTGSGEEVIRTIRINDDGSLSGVFGKGFYDEALRWELELLHLKNKN